MAGFSKDEDSTSSANFFDSVLQAGNFPGETALCFQILILVFVIGEERIGKNKCSTITQFHCSASKCKENQCFNLRI